MEDGVLQHKAWVTLSFRLSARFNLPIASVNIQRLGDLDVLLRCIENEFDANRAAQRRRSSAAMLSELWVVGWYEILRAFRRGTWFSSRRGSPTSGVNTGWIPSRPYWRTLSCCACQWPNLEIAKDDKLEEPLAMWRVGETGGRPPRNFYDRAGIHLDLMIHADGLGITRFRIVEKVARPSKRSRNWVERRDLVCRLFGFVGGRGPRWDIWRCESETDRTCKVMCG